MLAKHLNLDYASPESAELTSDTLRNICAAADPMRAQVQEVSVSGYGSLANWTEVTEALPCLDNLRELHWNRIELMPNMKVYLEENLPHCKLHLDTTPLWDYRSHRSFSEKDALPILGSPNLASLKAYIEYDSEPAPERISYIHAIMASCPNIRNFDLAFDHSGCIVSGGQPRGFDFTNRRYSNASLPPLEVLRLRGYVFQWPPSGQRQWAMFEGYFIPEHLPWPFCRMDSGQVERYMPPPIYSSLVDFKDWLFAPDRSPWIADTYERLTGDHDYSSNPENEPCYFPCCEPAPTDHVNLDAWIKQMSFSAIHTLELDWIDSTVSSRLFYRLLSLTNLSIHGADRCSTQSLQSYLEQPLQPLITLHLSNIQLPNNTFGPLITTLGSTHRNLSDLTLRAENTIVSPAELNRLASLLPNLTSLTLSHNRSLPLLPSSSRYSPEEEAAAAAAAATFSSLQQLKLHVPSPGDFYKTQQDTVFNASTLATQFRDLTSHHPANSTASTTSTAAVRNIPAPKLQELEVLIGPWSRRNENSMLGPPTDVMGRYVCTRQATGDDEKGGGGGAVVVECSGGVLSPWSRGGGALVEEGPCAREVLADDEDMDMYGGIDDFEIGDGTLEGESW